MLYVEKVRVGFFVGRMAGWSLVGVCVHLNNSNTGVSRTLKTPLTTLFISQRAPWPALLSASVFTSIFARRRKAVDNSWSSRYVLRPAAQVNGAAAAAAAAAAAVEDAPNAGADAAAEGPW